MRKNWSRSEVEAAVEDYFDMLRLELSGEKFNKTEHRRTLLARLDDRSHGSVELKHQNISAVLIEMGVPYINGYKPRSNYQRTLLPRAVCDYLERNPEFQRWLEKDSDADPVIPSVEDWLSVLEEPPLKEEPADAPRTAAQTLDNPTGVNWLEREARNQKLGNAGEEFIINYERARLIRAGRDSWVERIERVSETKGPSAGYDILSFETNGKDRYIEVKTTKYGKNTPFFVTRNELAFSQENSSRYHLYRLFRFNAKPGLFTLPGQLQGQCNLEPSQYRAWI